jgi:hypothetical protein
MEKNLEPLVRHIDHEDVRQACARLWTGDAHLVGQLFQPTINFDTSMKVSINFGPFEWLQLTQAKKLPRPQHLSANSICHSFQQNRRRPSKAETHVTFMILVASNISLQVCWNTEVKWQGMAWLVLPARYPILPLMGALHSQICSSTIVSTSGRRMDMFGGLLDPPDWNDSTLPSDSLFRRGGGEVEDV